MFVLIASPGSYVRACPPERHFEYTSDLGAALKFATEADALAYLDQEHPVRKLTGQSLLDPAQPDPIIGYFRRRSDLPHYVVNIGDA